MIWSTFDCSKFAVPLSIDHLKWFTKSCLETGCFLPNGKRWQTITGNVLPNITFTDLSKNTRKIIM